MWKRANKGEAHSNKKGKHDQNYPGLSGWAKKIYEGDNALRQMINLPAVKLPF